VDKSGVNGFALYRNVFESVDRGYLQDCVLVAAIYGHQRATDEGRSLLGDRVWRAGL
jgi:hypothetical protein